MEPTRAPEPDGRRRLRWLVALAVIGTIVGAAAVGVLFSLGRDPVVLAKDVLAAVQREVAGWPGPALLGAVAVLPAFGFPVSPLYLLSGARGTGFAVAGLAGAIAVNLSLSYLLARTLLRPFLEALLRRRGLSVPELAPGNHVRILVLVRLTPGMPLFVQSTILALAGLPFGLYLVGSFLLQYPIALAMALLGDAFVQGKAGTALAAIGAIVAFAVGFRLVRDRLAARRAREVVS